MKFEFGKMEPGQEVIIPEVNVLNYVLYSLSWVYREKSGLEAGTLTTM